MKRLDPNTSLVFDILRQLVLAEKPLEWRQANADLDKFRLAIDADPELLRLARIYLVAPSPIAIRVLVDLESKLRDKFY
jgi:hypothetical protein